MKIKLRIDKDEEFDYSESDYTMPIIINRTMILGVYDVHFFEMTDNIWRQLPEEQKENIAMEEIYKNFDKNKEINYFITGCDFPNSSMLVYFSKFRRSICRSRTR